MTTTHENAAYLSSVDDIKKVWRERAAQQGDDPHCTLPDYHLRHLEAEYISRHLRPEDEVLDIGCGNGTTTVRFAERARHVIGGDYAPEMIDKAEKLHPKDNVKYRTMDVLSLDAQDLSFDVVVTERCLINLPDWETQKKGIQEIARVLKQGGRFLMCESYEEAFVRFAALRKQFGLAPMRRHPNNYLIREEGELREFLSRLFYIRAIEKMGIYYLVSRTVHPLSVAPAEPTYDAKINDVAVRMTLSMDPSQFSEYSVNGLYVLEKK